MKKIVIVFSVGVSLILMGSFLMVNEISQWKVVTGDISQYGYNKHSDETLVNIESLEDNSITVHGRALSEFSNNTSGTGHHMGMSSNMGMMGFDYNVDVVVDEKQQEGILAIESEYYSDSRGCNIVVTPFDINFDDYYDRFPRNRSNNSMHNGMHNNRQNNTSVPRDFGDSKEMIEIYEECDYSNEMMSFMSRYHSGHIRNMFRNKEFPMNTTKLILTIHPNDEYKLNK